MKKSVKVSSITTKEKGFGRYILFGIIVLLIFLSYRIVAPYLIVLVSSFILAYLSKPVFNFLKKRVGVNFSAIICLVLILLIFIVPTTIIISVIATEATSIADSSTVTAMIDKISSLPILDKINFNWSNALDRVGLIVFSLVGTVATRLPTLLLSGLVFLFSFFYILVGGDYLTRKIKAFIPFKNRETIAQEIDRATHGIVFGYFLIAILDFIISAIGFYLAGVSYSLLWAFLVAILVFIPGLGPAFVNIPLLIYYAAMGNWYSVIILVIFWAIVSLFIETFLVSKVLAGRAKIHPLIMLIGILGGTTMFGLFGFIIGPLILVYTIKLVQELIKKD